MTVLKSILVGLLEEAVRPQLDELRALISKPLVEYRDRHQEAQRLGVSVSTLDREVLRGLPFVYVGDSRRFRAADVDAWLGARKRSDVQ